MYPWKSVSSSRQRHISVRMVKISSFVATDSSLNGNTSNNSPSFDNLENSPLLGQDIMISKTNRL